MEQFLIFVQDKWFIILAAAIALFIVIKVLKTVVKWIIVLAILAGLIVYGANYTDQLKEVSGKVIEYAKEEAFNALLGDVDNAQYDEQSDGTFTIKSSNDHITLSGSKGSDEVEISYRGQSFTFQLGDTLQSFIDQVKSEE